LLNTLICSVLGLEVQVRSPVVGEIFRELASGARGRCSNITRGHRSIETVSSYNLMDVAGWDLTRVDEGIETIDNCLRTSKSQHGGRTGCESLPVHGERRLVAGWQRFNDRRQGEECWQKHRDLVDVWSWMSLLLKRMDSRAEGAADWDKGVAHPFEEVHDPWRVRVSSISSRLCPDVPIFQVPSIHGKPKNLKIPVMGSI